MFRILAASLAFLALTVFASSPSIADDKDNIHTGKFLSASGQSFKMEDKGGKEHSHTLAANAKVLGADGKDCKLSDFQKGQDIRVTTREGDRTTAVRVEAIKRDNK